MIYPIAERFISPQGEGVHTGTVMGFIRFVGCSVGKQICKACDTDFDRIFPELNGGKYSEQDLAKWVSDNRLRHVCLTGGEPLDRDLEPLANALLELDDSFEMIHIETSGTREIQKWMEQAWSTNNLFLTVCPKPGYIEHVVMYADEVKVILGGLGDSMTGWPTVDDARKWAAGGHPVYIQPRNEKYEINPFAMDAAIAVVKQHPELRLSAQLHKFLRVR